MRGVYSFPAFYNLRLSAVLVCSRLLLALLGPVQLCNQSLLVVLQPEPVSLLVPFALDVDGTKTPIIWNMALPDGVDVSRPG
jgi:hypothetical protein